MAKATHSFITPSLFFLSIRPGLAVGAQVRGWVAGGSRSLGVQSQLLELELGEFLSMSGPQFPRACLLGSWRGRSRTGGSGAHCPRRTGGCHHGRSHMEGPSKSAEAGLALQVRTGTAAHQPRFPQCGPSRPLSSGCASSGLWARPGAYLSLLPLVPPQPPKFPF